MVLVFWHKIIRSYSSQICETWWQVCCIIIFVVLLLLPHTMLLCKTNLAAYWAKKNILASWNVLPSSHSWPCPCKFPSYIKIALVFHYTYNLTLLLYSWYIKCITYLTIAKKLKKLPQFKNITVECKICIEYYYSVCYIRKYKLRKCQFQQSINSRIVTVRYPPHIRNCFIGIVECHIDCNKNRSF